MLQELIVSQTRIALLKVLLLDPKGRFYLRELVARANVPLRSAQIELGRLAQSGIVRREISGKRTYYSINDRCPIIPELRSIFVKTVGLADVLKSALSAEAEAIRSAAMFGSFARGDEDAGSDVDLLIVGSISPRRVTALLQTAEVPRAVNPVVMSEEEFEERRDSADHFVTSVIESPLIMLIGEEDDLKRPA